MSGPLTVVIPTYNNIDQLRICLSTLFQYTFSAYPLKVVVVNNCPQDNEFLGNYLMNTWEGRSFHEFITLINMNKNAGWMGGVNAALAQCDTEMFCMLNDDVAFIPGQKDFWRRLLEPFTWSVEVGAVGPCSNAVMGAQSLFHLSGTWTTCETTLLSGVCMAVRTEKLRELGGLDEKLPGGDDLDLCIRMRQAGHRLFFTKLAFLYHHGQQTGRRLEGARWDSEDQKEQISNVLIRKHGMRAWWECVQDKIRPYSEGRYLDSGGILGQDMVDATLQEVEVLLGWVKENGGQGLHLGSGAWIDQELGVRVDMLPQGSTSGAANMAGYVAQTDVVCDITRLEPFEDGSQDFLVAKHSMEHLVDVLGALEEWKRVLREGGELFIAVPDPDAMDVMLVDHTHVHVFNEESLKRLLVAAGFEGVEVRKCEPWSILCRARKGGAG